ncbi:MAG: hypothetical protein IJ512_05410 [Ruminococcus sp.]|nr:hypothetical protein [Ruminococcus sp.]
MIMRGCTLHSVRDLKANFSIDELVYSYYSGELEIWLNNMTMYMQTASVPFTGSHMVCASRVIYRSFFCQPSR